MPTPMAICLEDPGARAPGERYLQCVAVVGRQPGLRVDRGGTVLWRSEEAAACELWVSLDEKLILFRPAGAAAVTVRRAGRVLDVPAGKPVVLIDQDEFEVGAKRLRVHVHGAAPAIVGPSFLPAPERKGAGRRSAAAVALGAVLGGAALAGAGCPQTPPAQPRPDESQAGDAGEQEDIEVRVAPPTVMPMPPPPPPPPPPPEPIEVRENPPGASVSDMMGPGDVPPSQE